MFISWKGPNESTALNGRCERNINACLRLLPARAVDRIKLRPVAPVLQGCPGARDGLRAGSHPDHSWYQRHFLKNPASRYETRRAPFAGKRCRPEGAISPLRASKVRRLA